MANVNINKDLILDMVYPIGSIYISINATSPATLFGGTWEPIYAKFLLGATPSAHGESIDSIMTGLGLSWSSGGYWYWPINGTRYRTDNGTAMGEAGHILTINEMPVHRHEGLTVTEVAAKIGNGNNGIGLTYDGSKGGSEIKSAYAGSGIAHNNLPPYLAVYMWKRTA